MAFVHDLVHRLRPGHLFLFLSDGLMAYHYALSAHLGFWRLSPRTARPVWVVASGFVYAQVIQVTRGRRLLAAFPHAVSGTLAQARPRLQVALVLGLFRVIFPPLPLYLTGVQEGLLRLSRTQNHRPDFAQLPTPTIVRRVLGNYP